MPRARKPPSDPDHPPPPPVYILSYSTNNPYFFKLPSVEAIISAHQSRKAAIEAGKTWIADMLEQQKQMEEDEQSRRVRWEDEEGWHTGDWEDLDGSWKSMINAKGGFKDLVVCVRRYEVSYVIEEQENT
ncbi:MAG: hypothetical protein HETSPECPRED_009745 [Heterodermia speciosa]|uniref:Uncharacterized protein n=1 Tax=Heterodermia speciosa TaxID=116794 RepID=A0A8H3G3W3_9LECA|nr:MAG: hypothetical protein HETSPECPRED_009745 [Heterodermia speciosa]